jgi:hypothetical protein
MPPLLLQMGQRNCSPHLLLLLRGTALLSGPSPWAEQDLLLLLPSPRVSLHLPLLLAPLLLLE